MPKIELIQSHPDYPKALKGDVNAALAIGCLYTEAHLPAEAWRFYSIAANKGSAEAKVKLAAILCCKARVETEVQESSSWDPFHGHIMDLSPACLAFYKASLPIHHDQSLYQQAADLFAQAIEMSDEKIVSILPFNANDLSNMYSDSHAQLRLRLNSNVGWHVILSIWSKLRPTSFASSVGEKNPYEIFLCDYPATLKQDFLSDLDRLSHSKLLTPELGLFALKVHHRLFIDPFRSHNLAIKASQSILNRLASAAHPLLINQPDLPKDEEHFAFIAYYHAQYADDFFDAYINHQLSQNAHLHLLCIAENNPKIAEKIKTFLDYSHNSYQIVYVHTSSIKAKIVGPVADSVWDEALRESFSVQSKLKTWCAEPRKTGDLLLLNCNNNDRYYIAFWNHNHAEPLKHWDKRNLELPYHLHSSDFLAAPLEQTEHIRNLIIFYFHHLSGQLTHKFKPSLKLDLLTLRPEHDFKEIIRRYVKENWSAYVRANTYIAKNLVDNYQARDIFHFDEFERYAKLNECIYIFYLKSVKVSFEALEVIASSALEVIAKYYLGGNKSKNYLVDFIIAHVTSHQDIIQIVKNNPNIALVLLKTANYNLPLKKEIALASYEASSYFIDVLINRTPKQLGNDTLNQWLYEFGLPPFDQHFLCADELIARRAYLMAANLLNQVASGHHDYLQAQYQAGHLYFMLKDKQRALVCFNAVIHSYHTEILIKLCQHNKECTFVEAIEASKHEMPADTWMQFFPSDPSKSISKEKFQSWWEKYQQFESNPNKLRAAKSLFKQSQHPIFNDFGRYQLMSDYLSISYTQ